MDINDYLAHKDNGMAELLKKKLKLFNKYRYRCECYQTLHESENIDVAKAIQEFTD
jgi:hypothetical protein